MNAGLDWYRSIDAENDLELITIDVQLDVALEVEQIMENQGVSRKELAERIGHSPAYVTKVLSGDANMTISTMVKLANALDRRPRIEFINKKARRSWHDALPPTGSRKTAVKSEWATHNKSRQPLIKHSKKVDVTYA
ncbi:helix-turn-helix domain-containing protein [Guyparkeria halophila]|uniref:Helix-turn-helix domain-containing protein n=1 Tax=Guyparkeria halophila TaxID=47960 RepID=A0A6I6CWM8_9GAMM|nr:helix-turn-helix transcriptional regulator [Guyparkeria halophila]QGT77730.1 helix-turn-helix domain-containing protein [Guyparkeria halophila]